MHPAVSQHLPALRTLCDRHRIRELYLFGSSAVDNGTFDLAGSDVDLLVEFLDADLGPWLQKYFAFKEDLEALLGRPVDLMMLGALSEPHSRVSPYFLAAVEASKVPVYAAA
jgi:uncharacterized protein